VHNIFLILLFKKKERLFWLSQET